MSKKDVIIQFGLVVFIFLAGLLIRVEIADNNSVSSDNQYYQNEYGLPYPYEMDSYYNYRLTSNFIEHGYLGDKVIDGREWDIHSYFPPGVPLDYPPLIAYLTAFFYYFVNLFVDVPLPVVCYWLPVIIAPLAGVVTYYFTRRYTNDYGAFTAGLLMVMAPYYILRTIPGWFDTDIFTILFPLIVVFLFMEAVNNRNLQKGFIFAILSAFFMFIFSLAWNGWQLYFYLISAFGIIYGIWCVYKKKDIKNYFYILITFMGFTLFLVFLTGYINILKLIFGPLDYIKIFGFNGSWNSWPDVYISVSELERPSIFKIIAGVGFSLLAGILGYLWAFRVLINKKLKNIYLNRMTWFFFLFLIIWALVGFFALNRGSRFILIIIPPFVLITGILVGIWTEYFKSLKNIKNYPIFQKKNVITYLSLALVIIVASISISNAFLDVSFIPIVNDDLDDAARWINGNTPINTVVISEWSYGHLLTANSNRSVIFDGRLGYVETLPIRNFDKSFKYGGSSPGVLRWYWFNKAFSTDNENLSKGIFSMLTSTGDEASMVLNQYSHNTTLTVEILNKILSENKEDAKNILINDYGMPGEQADNIIKYSHPDSHPPYVVMTTEEMKNNGFWIFYFGGWNFENNKSEEFSFRTGTLNQSADFINTTNGININLKTDNFTFNEEEPYAVFTISDGNVKKNFFNNTNDKVIVLLTDEEKWVVIDKKYQNSLFYKLLLVQQDTETFKIVYKNNKVIIWNNLQSIKG